MDGLDRNGKARPSTAYDADGIADAMKEADRWIVWRVGERDGAWTKVPCTVLGVPASVRDERHWLSWTEALEATEDGELGIGFVLGGGWLGVDFDKVAAGGRLEDTEDGRWIREWVKGCRTWCEWSPSRTGLHAIFRGVELPEWSQNRRKGTPVEVYEDARFFTVTGAALLPDRDCVSAQSAVDAVCDRWLRKAAPSALEAPTPSTGLPEAPEDASAADWRFVCSSLQAGVAPGVVESMLRMKMEREGRGEKARRDDYLQNTVAKAASAVQASPRRSRATPPEPRILEVKPFERGEFPREMRPPLVDGLFRRGEIVNWIGSSKTGKSWLLHRLVGSVVAGEPFPNRSEAAWHVNQGRVLLIDNELHEETLENRLHSVAYQMRIPSELLRERLDVVAARGLCMTLDDVEATLVAKGPRAYDLVCIDALYKTIPAGLDENANADMAQLYNQLDRIALKAEAAILVVHHATKGVQTGKSVMDIGAGAGAIGRATDAHITFLRHRVDGCISMQCETRSFKRPEPCVLSTLPAWPCLAIDNQKDPSDLWYPGCDSDEDE